MLGGPSRTSRMQEEWEQIRPSEIAHRQPFSPLHTQRARQFRLQLSLDVRRHMGRQLSVDLTDEEEARFLGLLRESGEIQIFRHFARAEGDRCGRIRAVVREDRAVASEAEGAAQCRLTSSCSGRSKRVAAYGSAPRLNCGVRRLLTRTARFSTLIVRGGFTGETFLLKTHAGRSPDGWNTSVLG
jgi:hypothetical protein